MTTNEPPPPSGETPPTTSGLPSYGSVPPPEGGYPPPPPGGYPPPAPGGYAAPQGNKKALWSMILGIISLVCCGFITGIPALILGNQAKNEINASQGAQTGLGQAKAGVILGIIAIVWSVIYVVLVAAGVLDLSFDSSSS